MKCNSRTNDGPVARKCQSTRESGSIAGQGCVRTESDDDILVGSVGGAWSEWLRLGGQERVRVLRVPQVGQVAAATIIVLGYSVHVYLTLVTAGRPSDDSASESHGRPRWHTLRYIDTHMRYTCMGYEVYIHEGYIHEGYIHEGHIHEGREVRMYLEGGGIVPIIMIMALPRGTAPDSLSLRPRLLQLR